jgi:hypothetical protein
LGFRHRVIAGLSDFQQALLQEYQSSCASHSTVADLALKYDWNLAPQQNPSALRNFLSNGSQQLRTGLGDIPANDQDFRIEDVQNTDQGSGQVFEGAIDYATSAFVSLSRGAKNSFGAGRLASLAER